MKPRSSTLVVALVMLLPFDVRAGTVGFTPETTEIVLGVDDPMVKIDVAIASLDTMQQFDAADVVVGSHDGLGLDFTYSPEACYQHCSSYPLGLYLSDVAFGFFIPTFPVPEAPFLIGTLVVDTSGFALGTYELIVDHDFDGRSAVAFGLPAEPLYGLGAIQIVPEPGTLALLGLGSLAAAYRQRQRRVPGVRDRD